MKRTLFIHISIVFLLISCQNTEKSSLESSNNIEGDNQVEDKFFYVEFIHPEDSIAYGNSIELVKKKLLKNGYIAGKDFENGHQGIRKIDSDEYITIRDVNKYQHNIHKFKDFSKYDPNDGDIEKIVITVNKPINDSIPNFNFRSYKKLGHEDWQSTFNPGNFRYIEKKTFDESKFANWMSEIIVLLTFK